MSQTISYTYIASQFPSLPGVVQRSTDGAYIPCDLENMDYQAFLSWVAAGNTAPTGWTGPRNP
jgi:hypothetical protein